MQNDDVEFELEDGEGNTQTGAQKLKDLREEPKKAHKERDEYLDSLQRMKADYINAKRRFEEEKDALGKFASAGIVLELIPIMDALEQALLHDSTSSDGVKNIKTQLEKVFLANGVLAFGEVGESFDPNLHEAVETLAVDEETKDNIVTKVHQKGYTLNGRTIRPARIAVGHYKE